MNNFNVSDVMIRNTIQTYEKSQNFNNYKEFIEIIKNDNIFLEQILLANPKLYGMLKKYNAGKLKKKKEKNFFESIYKYYKRSYYRATPFGLFSETSNGKFTVKGDKKELGKTHKVVFIDIKWLTDVIFKLEKDYQSNLSFISNNGNYISGNRVMQLYSINDQDLEEVSINNSKVYRIISEECSQTYKTYSEIIEKVITIYGNEYLNLTKEYINDLVENHYLISNLQENILINFSMSDFIMKVREIDVSKKYVEILTKIQELIEEYTHIEIGSGSDKLIEIYHQMARLNKSDNYIQVDLYNDGNIYIDNSNKQRIEKFSNFITNTVKSVTRTYFDDYKDKFIEKYGIDQDVQLIELFDPIKGIGAPYDYTHPQNEVFELEPPTSYYSHDEKEMYINKYIEALLNREEINLKCFSNYYRNLNSKESTSIQGIELFFHMVQINKKKTLALSNIIGSNNIGGSSGRFSLLSDKLRDYHMKTLKQVKAANIEEGVTSCEIVFLPENIRHANIMRTSFVREKVLPIFSSTDQSEVRLTNIYIGLDENENFYAYDVSTQEKMKFYVTSMYNKTLFSNELRFLCEISINNNFGYVPWDLIYKDMNFIPRIMFEDIVVSPKTWRIFKFELSNIAIESIIKQRNIPNEIYIVDGDNKLYINRKNSLDVELFMSEIKRNIEKNGHAIIQEYFNNKDMIYKDSEGKISEIVVPVINSKFDVKKVNKEKQQRISKHVREKLPFNDWLYLKVYMSTRRQEEFIRVYIPLIQKKVEKLDRKLFFLRYMDPVPQIRIRISDNNLYKIYEVIKKDLEQGHRNGILSTFDISTYDREIERYGGVNAIDIAENIFCEDSKLVIKYLKFIKEKNMEDKLDDIAVAMIYFYLKIFYKINEDILCFLDKVCPNKVDKNVRSKIQYYKSVVFNQLTDIYEIDKYNFNRLKEEIKKLKLIIDKKNADTIMDSIIHVHNNRLFGINRVREQNLYFIVKKMIMSEKYILKGK